MDAGGGVTAANGIGPIRIEDCERGIPSVFEDVVRRCPNGIALQTPELCLTYDELNRRANQVAHALLADGTTSGDVIAIAAESTPRLAVALLGVLKAGGVAVFLDPKSPPVRQAEILSECGARQMLADDALRPSADGLGVRRLEVGTFDGLPDRNPETRLSPDALMAIYFTSGTTGRPKGICRSHRQGIFEARLYIRTLEVTSADRLLMPVSFTFGASTRYTFGAWLSGATLCPVAPDSVGVAGLVRFAREVGATLYYSTPSLFRHICRAIPEESPLDAIRAVTLTGETVRQGDLDGFRRFMGSRQGVLINSLGSTECGAYCHLRVTPDLTFPDDVLPAGIPLENKEVLIVDDLRRPIPDGETGEIAVRSAYLTPGYWRRPDLDQERLAADAERPGMRVFYTGDLGFRDDRGRIHVRGRKDFQLKIRGYRVEPGEIEAVLCRCPGIRGAVVLPTAGPGGHELLVAYLTLQTGVTAPDRDEIDRHLLQHLPPYMAPARYQILEEFPLTARDKIDRSAVPRAPSRPLDRTLASVTLSDPMVAELRQMWGEVLRRDPSTLTAGFFELGGDSLTAMQLLKRVHARWNIVIPISAFYQSPTVEALARWITARVVFGPESVLFPLNEAVEGLPDLYFLPGWGRNTLELLPLAQALAGEFNCLGLELPPAGDADETLEELAAYCAGIIASRKPSRPIYLGGFSLGGLMAFEAGRQLDQAGVPIARVFILDTNIFALRPSEGWPWARRVFRNFVRYPLRTFQFFSVYLWLNHLGPAWRRWTGQPAESFQPNLGRMPHRDAARAYIPQRASLRITFPHSWERRLELLDDRDPWQQFTSHPVRSVQLPVCSHAVFVQPSNLADLVPVLVADKTEYR